MIRTILNWWHDLRLDVKLYLLLMSSILVILLLVQFWIQNEFEQQITKGLEKRADAIADGTINGLNMLMLYEIISEPGSRRILIKKMSETTGIKELRIIRAEQVNKQFGPGLLEEQLQDDMDKLVLSTGKEHHEIIIDKDGQKSLRVVRPFIASTSFRGTNCLICHHVPDNSVNGAASIIIDMTDEERFISEINKILWAGQAGVEIFIFITIALITRNIVFTPLEKMEKDIKKLFNGKNMDTSMLSRSHDVLHILSDEVNQLLLGLDGLDMQEELSLFNKMMEHINEGIIITDTNGIIITVNQTFTDITGYRKDECVGQSPAIIQSGKLTREFYRALWKSLTDTGQWQGEVWDKKKNGEIYPAWMSISSIHDENGTATYYIAIFNDISERKQNEERMSHQVRHDSLTGLPNRVAFYEYLSQALSDAFEMQQLFAVLFIDLDRFKSVNDILGHDVGDQLLQEVAGRLQNYSSENIIVARLGGDEFTMLVKNLRHITELMLLLGDMINSIRPVFTVNERRKLYVTLSIGVSLYPHDGSDMQTLLKNADISMYRAKQCGKEFGSSNYQFFNDLSDFIEKVNT